MKKVTVQEIKSFSVCPAYYSFNKINPLLEVRQRQVSIFTSIVQKCFLRHTESGSRVDWRNIVGWVDKEVFKDIDFKDEKLFEEARTKAEYLLNSIKTWYKDEYQGEVNPGYIDIDLERNIGNFVVSTTIPIVKASDPTTLIYIDDNPLGTHQMTNDIALRTMGWLASKVLNIKKINIQHLVIKKQGGFESSVLKLDERLNSRTEKRLSEILYAMDKGLSYPSRSEICNTCPFKSICSI